MRTKDEHCKSNSVFYILKGQQFINEAAFCAASYAKWMPDVSRILFTVGEGFEVPLVFEHNFPLKPCPDAPSEAGWFYEWLYQMPYAVDFLVGMGYHGAIFSDCDVFLVDAVYELFDMINYFYLVGAHAPGRQTTKPASGVTLAFPEVNTGFVPMRVCEEVIGFWVDVFTTYVASRDVYGNNDQGAFRDTLWRYAQQNKHFPWYVLPPEYNLRFNFPCSASKKVKVLHGHSDQLTRIAQRVNTDGAMRAWENGVKVEGD